MIMASITYLTVTTMLIVFLFSTVLPVGAQCYGYGCGQNSTVLNQALFEKQTEVIQQQNEQLDHDSQIIILLIGISIGLGCVIGIIALIFLKTRKISKK
jgi:hypothetical protein